MSDIIRQRLILRVKFLDTWIFQSVIHKTRG